MGKRIMFFAIWLSSSLYAMPTQCYDSLSGEYDLQTGKEKSLKKDKLKLYFKQDGKDFLVSSNQYNWNPLVMIANNEENAQFLEPISAGVVLYTYHKKIKKMVIQKSYSYPLIGSLIVTAVLNKCIE